VCFGRQSYPKHTTQSPLFRLTNLAKVPLRDA
jgi:hypothetical protein